MAAKSSSRPELTDEQKLVLGIIDAKARGKKAYGKAKEYLAKLQMLGGKGAVTLPDGRKFEIVDTFKGEDTLKKMVFLDRWELQEK